MKLPGTLLFLALAAPGLAWGQAYDPPERVARLAYVEGGIAFAGAGERTSTTLPERPLAPGDRIITEPGGRAELAMGTATIRLDEHTELLIADLDAAHVRVELAAGTASVYLRELLEDETFEIVTPNSIIALDGPGEYRADVFADDSTALTVQSGAATADTAGGPVRVASGQRVRLEGRDALARLETPRPRDSFDEWILEREVRLAEVEPPRYTPYEGDEYRELDQYGEWYDEPRYGRVWMPAYGYSGWSPYYGGYWQRAGFGWSWYDPAPWGFFTYYSGRWAYLNHLDRWCWVPGPRFHRRHFAHGDTRPFGRPRGDRRERVVPEAAPRTASRRNAADELPRVAMPSLAPRRNDAATPRLAPRRNNDVEPPRLAPRRSDVERRPAPRREIAAGEPPRRMAPARDANREPRPAPRAAEPRRGSEPSRASKAPRVSEAPRGGGGTMRPSRAEPPARSEARSERSQGPAFGTRR